MTSPPSPSSPEEPRRTPRGGGRKTKQREAIRQVFERSGRPLSPQEILELGQDQAEGLSLPTVYRALKAMTEAGELTAVELPGQAARYELGGLHHHHHFLCEDCGRLFDIPGCPGAVHALAPEGYQVARHDLTLIGSCPDCSTL